MQKVLCLVLALLTLSACGSRLEMDRRQIADKTMQVKSLDVIDFRESTFGQYEANWWLSAGDAGRPMPVSDEHQKMIADVIPTPDITKGVETLLANDLGWRTVSENPDFAVEVKQWGWGMRFHALIPTLYHIYYDATLRIWDLRSKDSEKTPREWFYCSYKTDSKYNYDEIYANNAEVVRKERQEAVKACNDELSRKLRTEIEKDSKP